MMDIHMIDNILINKLGATKDYKAEWGWTSYKVGGKMFAAICTPSDKYAKEYANHPLVTLKCDTLESEFLQNNYSDILSGFYMDKRFWISVRLDGDIKIEFIVQLCDKSYQMVFSKLTKKLQKEISEK